MSPRVQRGLFSIGLILSIAGAVIIATAIGVGVYKAQRWCNVACKDSREETKAQRLKTDEQSARADAAEARERAAAAEEKRVRTAWAQESVAAQSVSLQLERERHARFAAVEAAARNLPPAVGGIRFPAAGVRLLNDGVAAANAAIAPAAGQPAETAAAATGDSDVASVTSWGLTCQRMYADVAAQVSGWIAWYGKLQAAQSVAGENQQ